MHVYTWDNDTEEMRPMTEEEYAQHLQAIEKIVNGTNEADNDD